MESKGTIRGIVNRKVRFVLRREDDRDSLSRTRIKIHTNDGKTLTITPKRGKERKKFFKKGLAKMNKKYGKALKKLAE